MPDQNRKHLQVASIGAAECLIGIGSNHNLMDMNMQMPIANVDIRDPTTIAVGLFFMSQKEQNVLVDLRSIFGAKI